MGLFADERELGGGKPVRGNLKEPGVCLGLGRGIFVGEKKKLWARLVADRAFLVLRLGILGS
jgi:hypothetical protein